MGTQLGMAVAPGADGVFWRFRARRAQPPSHLPSCTSPPAHGAGPTAATHPFWGHQCPTGTTPVTASPSGDHASSRKRWHHSHCPPAPPARPGLAQEKNSPLCATIARLSPEPPGPFPPAPGSCPTRSAPSRAPLLPPGQWARPPQAPHTCAPGCPAPALRHCPRGVSHGGYFKAELPLPRRGPVAGQGGAAKPRATRLAGNRQQHREPPRHLPGDPSAMGLLRQDRCRTSAQLPAPLPPVTPGAQAPAGSQHSVTAGSLPAVTGVSFWPLSDDSRATFPPLSLERAWPPELLSSSQLRFSPCSALPAVLSHRSPRRPPVQDAQEWGGCSCPAWGWGAAPNPHPSAAPGSQTVMGTGSSGMARHQKALLYLGLSPKAAVGSIPCAPPVLPAPSEAQHGTAALATQTRRRASAEVCWLPCCPERQLGRLNEILGITSRGKGVSALGAVSQRGGGWAGASGTAAGLKQPPGFATRGSRSQPGPWTPRTGFGLGTARRSSRSRPCCSQPAGSQVDIFQLECLK